MGSPISFQARERIMQLARRAGFKALVIIGAGEPTENFTLIRQVIGTASQIGLDMILFSTASRLDEAQATFYAQHDVTFIVSLDSLDGNSYRRLTGNGDLKRVLENIALLRRTYASRSDETSGDADAVRLGINATVVRQNVSELADIRRFAGEDMLLVSNAPIRRGKFASQVSWSWHVGTDEEYEELVRKAKDASETKSHSSTFRGVCGYFSRGVAIDVDGAILSCGYASETAESFGQTKDLVKPQDLLELHRTVLSRFRSFCHQFGRTPSCPLRDPEVDAFVRIMRG
jgi:MoaA/NifB/PqqE/SkfB family radical SAM enzyme